MKKTKREPSDHDDEDDLDLPDITGDVDWNELIDLWIRICGDEDQDEEHDYALLGSYARDERCERRETRHRRD